MLSALEAWETARGGEPSMNRLAEQFADVIVSGRFAFGLANDND